MQPKKIPAKVTIQLQKERWSTDKMGETCLKAGTILASFPLPPHLPSLGEYVGSTFKVKLESAHSLSPWTTASPTWTAATNPLRIGLCSLLTLQSFSTQDVS